MPLVIALSTFITVTLTVYGLLYRTTATDPMESRLRGLRYTRPGKESLPDPEAAFTTRVLKPVMRAIAGKAERAMPSTLSSRVELALTQAGLKVSAGHFILLVGLLAGLLPVVAVAMFAANGASGVRLLFVYGVTLVLVVYAARIYVLGRIKRRQKEIWKSLPDAFDLITASVEAGLGVDAAFSRVIEKVSGPFAEELTRTMREVTMGRSRREAFIDMAERTGVEELRQLINAIVQAESMGISIGSVIRVQTGVIRTKRRQRAEEQAFKAPIKMVFPLVFFIFPAIMVVIGGPAVIQMMKGF